MAYTAINDPSAFFKCQLYTGNGSADHAITFDDTDTDMQPDLVWIKNRDATDSHCLFDAVRGVTNVLHSDTNDAEDADDGTLDTFQSDGFKVDDDVQVNTNTETFVSWNWKAGTTSGKTTTGETITPTAYSINATSGFGIYAWDGSAGTGAIAHGLSSAPQFFIVKRRDGAQNWYAGGPVLTSGDYNVYLNTTAAETEAGAALWQSNFPSSTLMYLGADGEVNGASRTFVMYSFSAVQGYSKFGKYVGNGNADGPFVYTGFRPAFLLAKCSSTTSGGAGAWYNFDNKRIGYNFANYNIKANDVDGDAASTYLELLSNGFKIRNAAADLNGSGNTYIYAAFAEAPFVNSEGVPGNAR